MVSIVDGGENVISARLEQQAALQPDAIAAVCGDQWLTYSCVNSRANQLAAHLAQAHQTGPIAMSITPGLEMLSVILGVIKAGLAYVPIDCTLPLPRARAIVEDSGASLWLVADEAPQCQLEGVVTPRVAGLISAIAGQPTASVMKEPHSGALSIMYTSGVTGQPKGVRVPMRAAMPHMEWMWKHYPRQDGDIGLVHRSYMLVASIWDICLPLLDGVPICIMQAEDIGDIARLWSCCVRHRVSYLAAAPSLWRNILEYARNSPDSWTSLRIGVTSGEPASPQMVDDWRALFPTGRLLNAYGLTECLRPLVYDTSGMEAGCRRVPVGRPMPGIDVAIVDEDGRRLPQGTVGELWIAGSCASEGYINLPQSTEERFVKTQTGTTVRTGDLAFVGADGAVQIVGRRDRQVKIRGRRVELEDIEAALLRVGGVRSAVVTTCADLSSDAPLVAYVVPEVSAALRPLDVRTKLKTLLPDYMVPSKCELVDRLPLTRSGKVDYTMLSVPARHETTGVAVESSDGETARALASMWSEVLGVSIGSVSEEFFEAGGHSLAAMMIALRVRERYGVELHLRAFFDHPTVGRLADHIDTLMRDEANVVGRSSSE